MTAVAASKGEIFPLDFGMGRQILEGAVIFDGPFFNDVDPIGDQLGEMQILLGDQHRQAFPL